MGMLAAFAVYVSVPLIEQRLPDELGLAHLARELAAGIAVGALVGNDGRAARNRRLCDVRTDGGGPLAGADGLA
jgi:hypothetical protein